MLNNDDTTSGAAPVEEKPKRKAKEKTESVDKKQLRVAQLIIAHFKRENIIYHEPTRDKSAGGKAGGCFWLWREKVWRPVSDRLLKRLVHTHGLQAGERITRSFVDSVTDLAKNEAYRDEHEFDADRSGINVENGTLKWAGETWVLHPHQRDEYRTVMLPIVYDPAATAPRFERFLDEIFAPDDDKDEKSRLIMEAIGYSLTTSTDLERFFVLAGEGSNGKSVLLAVLVNLVGRLNASAVQPPQFENRFQRAYLHRKYINVVTELKAGAELPDDIVKAIVSGESITVEHKMQPPFDFCPFCTLWIGTNHIPTTRDFSDALFRRTMIIPFNRQFGEEEQENKDHLIKTLTSEASGILNLALDAYAGAIKRNGFTMPPSVSEAVAEWREDADPMQSFVRDIIIHDDKCRGRDAERSAIFYESFTSHCEAIGARYIISQKDFVRRLIKMTGARKGRTMSARTIECIRLITQEELQARLDKEEAEEKAKADVPF